MDPSSSLQEIDVHNQGKNQEGSDTDGRGASRKGISRLYTRLTGNKALLLFLALLILYNITLKINFSNDITPNMYLPISMIKHGSITLNHFPQLYASGTPYYLYPYQGSYYSAYGIGTSLFAAPFYLPLLLFQEMPSYITILYLSKFVAAFYAALSAVFLFAAIRRLTKEKWALIISLIYALLTPVFCTSSQALWQHAPSLFLISLAIYFLVRGEENPLYTALSGLPLGLAVLVRTNNLVVVASFIIYIVWKKRSQVGSFLLWLLPGALITALYNYLATGAFYTFPLMARMKYFPSGELYKIPESAGFWGTPFWKGFFGNLISPSRGVLITAPVLLVALFGIVCLFINKDSSQRKYRYLYYCFALSFLFHLLLISKWTSWAGGFSFGNRLLIDALPFLCMLFIPAFDFYADIKKPVTKSALSIIFILLIIFSVVIQVEGIISYDGDSWSLGPESAEEMAWKVRDNQFFFYLKNPEPVVPPLIKNLTGDPARLSSLRLELSDVYPHFDFHLSEFAIVKWYVIPPDSGGEKFNLVATYFSKGENSLVITDEDQVTIAEMIGYEGDIQSQKAYLFEASGHVFEVVDPLTSVRKYYYLE